MRQGSDIVIPIGLLFLSAFLLHFPRIVLDFNIYSGDSKLYFVSAVDFARALDEGQALPRWVGWANNGLGEPVHMFFSPLFYYATALVAKITGEIWLAMKVVTLIACWAMGVLGYLILRRLDCARLGLFAAVCLQLTPILPFYLFKSVHTYSNAAGLLLVVYCLLRYQPRAEFISIMVALAVFLTLVMHSLSGIMNLMCLFLGLLAAALLTRRNLRVDVFRIVGFGLSSLIGLGLALFHVLPAYIAKSYVNPAWQARDLGASMMLPVVQEASELRWFTVQWTLPLLFLAVNISTSWLLWRLRDRWSTKHDFALVCLCASWSALLLGSGFAVPVWEVLTPLQTLQFGHRLAFPLTLFGLLACLATAVIAWHGDLSRLMRQASVLPAVLSAVIGALVLAKFSLLDAAPSAFAGSDGVFIRGTHYFRPITAGEARYDYVEAGGFQTECRGLGIDCASTRDDLHDRRWMIDAGQSVQVRLPVLHFPGWAVSIDFKKAEISPDPETGLISVEVPEGRSFVRLYWSYAGYERIGIAASLAFLIVLMVVFGLRRKAGAPQHGGDPPLS